MAVKPIQAQIDELRGTVETLRAEKAAGGAVDATALERVESKLREMESQLDTITSQGGAGVSEAEFRASEERQRKLELAVFGRAGVPDEVDG